MDDVQQCVSASPQRVGTLSAQPAVACSSGGCCGGWRPFEQTHLLLLLLVATPNHSKPHRVVPFQVFQTKCIMEDVNEKEEVRAGVSMPPRHVGAHASPPHSPCWWPQRRVSVPAIVAPCHCRDIMPCVPLPSKQVMGSFRAFNKDSPDQPVTLDARVSGVACCRLLPNGGGSSVLPAVAAL